MSLIGLRWKPIINKRQSMIFLMQDIAKLSVEKLHPGCQHLKSTHIIANRKQEVHNPQKGLRAG